MELQFPKARLFAYNQLLGGASCFSVLLQAVIDAGLISEDSARMLEAQGAHGDGCGSFHAARNIIDVYMSERHNKQNARVHADNAYNQVRENVIAWQKQSPVHQGRKCHDHEVEVPCRDIAPVVLDFMLQEINKH